MTIKINKKRWAFAHAREDIKLAEIPQIPSMYEMYRRAMNTRDSKRELYERALNAALENLFSWERAARADGFAVIAMTDEHNGALYPVFSKDGTKVTFVQAYGVRVTDEEEK